MADYGDPTEAAEQGLGAAASIGVGAATGNPIAIMGGIASLAGSALSFFGAKKKAGVQQEEAKVSADIAAQEEAINKQRQNLATITYQRQSLENFRKTQLASAAGKAAAVNQGGSVMSGQSGSGYSGGQAQVEEAGAWNQLGLSENYQIGQNIFGLTSNINADKMKLAQLGGSAAGYQGLSDLGSGLASAGPALTRLSAGFGLPNPGVRT